MGHLGLSQETFYEGKCLFLMIFWRWIQICFQNFSVTHIFRYRLKGGNFLRQDTNVCFYRGHHEEFKDFFQQKNSVVSCNDIYSVMEDLGHEYNSEQWRLFINSSKVSLMVVLLHSGNTVDSPPFLWLIQLTWRNVMKAWSCCWENISAPFAHKAGPHEKNCERYG